MSRAVQAHHWSALRLSQPLSGFRFDRVPRPCFVPQPFLDCLPSECSPREDRVPLSGPLAPLQLSTVLRNAPPATLSPEVSPTPTLLAQLPGSPTNYGSPFHGSEGPLPGRPGSQAEGSPRPPASPASKLCSLRETVPKTLGRPSAPGRDSPGFLPLRSLPFHTSGSRPARTSKDPGPLPRPWTRVRGLEDRSPPRQVRPAPARVLGWISSTDSSPLRTGPHRLSTATPSLVTLGSGEPAPGLQSFEVRGR
jgi:hypothetical protein